MTRPCDKPAFAEPRKDPAEMGRADADQGGYVVLGQRKVEHAARCRFAPLQTRVDVDEQGRETLRRIGRADRGQPVHGGDAFLLGDQEEDGGQTRTLLEEGSQLLARDHGDFDVRKSDHRFRTMAQCECRQTDHVPGQMHLQQRSCSVLEDDAAGGPSLQQKEQLRGACLLMGYEVAAGKATPPDREPGECRVVLVGQFAEGGEAADRAGEFRVIETGRGVEEIRSDTRGLRAGRARAGRCVRRRYRTGRTAR